MLNLQQSIRNVGIGLRSCHYQYILENLPAVPWFEILSDNYLSQSGESFYYLSKICEHYPVAMHGVGLSLGSTDPLNKGYLKKLKQLAERIKPAYISDHLCWISVEGQYLHELMPLPYTEEAITHVVERIRQVQDYLGQQILIENVSNYLRYTSSVLSEAEFLSEIANRADCHILLDINNIYVSATNHQFDAMQYLNNIDKVRVKQYHLAGYQDQGTHLLDTHGASIDSAVWELYKIALQKTGKIPTLLEWDNNIPEFPVLMAEAKRAQIIMDDLS